MYSNFQFFVPSPALKGLSDGGDINHKIYITFTKWRKDFSKLSRILNFISSENLIFFKLGYFFICAESKKHSLLKKESLHVMINLVEQCSGNFLIAQLIVIRANWLKFCLFSEYSNQQGLQRITNVYKDHMNDLSKDADPIIALQTSQLKELLKNSARNNLIQL